MSGSKKRLVIAGNNCFSEVDPGGVARYSELDAAMLRPFTAAWKSDATVLCLDTETDRHREATLDSNVRTTVIGARQLSRGLSRVLTTPLLLLRTGRALADGPTVGYARLPSPMGRVMLIAAAVMRKPVICSIHGMPRGHGQKPEPKGTLRRTRQLVMGYLIDRAVVVFSTHPEGPGAYGSAREPVLFKSTVLDRLPQVVEGNRQYGQALRLGFFGRFSREKNPLHAIEVADQLVARGYSVTLEMVGSGPLQGALKERALRATSTVRFHGWLDSQDDLHRVLESTDFTLVTSHTEGSPKVLVEAMAFGVPALILPHNESVLRMAQGGAAVLVRTLAVDVWCDAIEKHWNEESYTALQDQGRLRARNYTVDGLVRHIAEVFSRFGLSHFDDA